jgi:hypothetical protein
MVFLQAALLGGYAYAHATTAWLGIRRQTILHLALLAVPLAVLSLGVDASRLPGGEANPVLGVLVLLSLSVGLPFLGHRQMEKHRGRVAAANPKKPALTVPRFQDVDAASVVAVACRHDVHTPIRPNARCSC